MSRMLSWKKSNTYAGTVWTSKIRYPSYCNNIDLSFTIEAGMYGGFIDKNAKLIVRKRMPSSKIAKNVIIVKEFNNSYKCKDFIDALLMIAIRMFKNESKESNKAELWFLEQLNNTPDESIPEPPTTLRTNKSWFFNNGQGTAR